MLISMGLVFGFFEFGVAIIFLVLSYKFSSLARRYKVDGFKDLSLGFRFVFISYFAPILGGFLGSLLVSETTNYFELIFTGLPYFACMILAMVFFFKSIKSLIEYANA